MGEVKEPLVEARLPTKYGTFRIIAFPGDNSDKENLALVMGKVEGEILIRIHSECFTGDVLHSMRCDCGEQLDGYGQICRCPIETTPNNRTKSKAR